jgi:hypothetical protein
MAPQAYGLGTAMRVTRRGSSATDTSARRSCARPPSERGFRENLRSNGVASLDRRAEAGLERSGKLGVPKASRPPLVVEVRVADGVQTSRLGLG